jgi:hypothetical protein
MPNNASARRGKDKKNKDKKKKDDHRTDTLSLPKEDTAGMDSGTLSLFLQQVRIRQARRKPVHLTEPQFQSGQIQTLLWNTMLLSQSVSSSTCMKK